MAYCLSAVILMLGGVSESVHAAEKESDVQETDAEKTEPETVRMMIYPPYCSKSTFNHVLEKINEYLEEKISVHLQVDFVQSGQEELIKYLMETPDADLIYVSDFQNSVNNGLLLPLDELLKVEGKDICQVLTPEQIELGQIDGIQYGLMRNVEMGACKGIVMRTDLLEKYEIDPQDIRSWDDVELVFGKIKENEPDIYETVADIPSVYDPLQDRIAVLTRKDGDVVNFYGTEECREYLERLYRWGQKGYLYDKDNYRYGQGSTRYFLYELMREGKLFSYVVGYKPGIAAQEEKNYGYDMTEIQLEPQIVYDTDIVNFQWGISSGSSHTKAAMKLLNLLYTDQTVTDLFCNGIEGEHYIKDAQGFLQKTDTEKAETYFFNRNWMLPDGYSAQPWEGDMENLQEQIEIYNKESERSSALGFWFDDTPVAVELEQCQAVTAKYLPGFLEGKFDPEKVLPVLNEELKSCGVDKIVEEKQRQLDEWKKRKK